jgi:hypothetical protein
MSEESNGCGWSPDAETVGHAIEVLGAATGSGGGAQADFGRLEGPTAEQIALAAGKLTQLGELDALNQRLARIPDRPSVAERALQSVDFAALDAAGWGILELCAGFDQPADGASETDNQRLLAKLAARDRAELLLIGIEALLGCPPTLAEEQQLVLTEFEMLVRPELWKLVPLNRERAAALAWVEPSRRARIWWWHQGADIPPDGLDALSTAAQMIRHFPHAAEELSRRVAADQVIDQLMGRTAAAPLPAFGAEATAAASLQRATRAAAPATAPAVKPVAGLESVARLIAEMSESKILNNTDPFEPPSPWLVTGTEATEQTTYSRAELALDAAFEVKKEVPR